MNALTEPSAIDKPEKALRRHRLYWLLAMAAIYGLVGSLATQYVQFLPFFILDHEVTRFWDGLLASSPPFLQPVYSLIFSFEFWAFCLIYLLKYVSAQKILLYGLLATLLLPLSEDFLHVLAFAMLTYLCLIWSDKQTIARNLGLVLGMFYLAASIEKLQYFGLRYYPALTDIKLIYIAIVIAGAAVFVAMWKWQPATAIIPRQNFHPIMKKQYWLYYLLFFGMNLRNSSFALLSATYVSSLYGGNQIEGYVEFYFLATIITGFSGYLIFGYLVRRFGEKFMLNIEIFGFLLCCVLLFTWAAPIALILMLVLPFHSLVIIASFGYLKNIAPFDELAGTSLMAKTIMLLAVFISSYFYEQIYATHSTTLPVVYFAIAMLVWMALVYAMPNKADLAAETKQASA